MSDERLYWHERESIRREGGLPDLGEEPTPELRVAIGEVLKLLGVITDYWLATGARLQTLFGRLTVNPSWGNPYREAVLEWVERCSRDELLTTLEVVAEAEPQFLSRRIHESSSGVALGNLAESVNDVFARHRFGFEMALDGNIQRIGSPALHEELVRPALIRLRDDRFREVEGHFVEALAQFRAREPRRSVFEAGTAVEALLHALGYQGNRLDRLAEDFRRRGGERGYVTEVLDQLERLMEALYGLRSDKGGHAARPGDEPVPESYALFAIHLAGAFIVFLTDRERGD